MVKVYFVSFTDPVSGEPVVDLHIGTKPLFLKDGLQMVTESIRVDNIFMHLDDKNTIS